LNSPGRPKNPETAAVTATADPVALAEGNAALTLLGQNSADVAARFGDDERYDRHRVVGEARFFMAQSAEAMLELGKRLILIKENEPHGDFVLVVTGQLGIEERSARRMMTAAVKYLSPALSSKRTTLSVLGKSKLFDLMTEDDDALEVLAEGGTLAGHTLDEIESMSARELKAALRESREDAAAKDKLIEHKDKKINSLVADKKFKPSAESAARNAAEQALLEQLQEATGRAEAAFIALCNVVDGAVAENNPALRVRAQQAVQYLIARMALVIDEHGIDVDMSAGLDQTPDWMKAAEAAKAADAEAGADAAGATEGSSKAAKASKGNKAGPALSAVANS
jgi:hypothetical protein